MTTQNNQHAFQAQEIQAVYKRLHDGQLVTIECAKDSEQYIRKFWPVQISYQEAFMVIYMNQSNKVIAHNVISIGGITGTFVDLRMIFQNALLSSAVSLVLVHNHPSGQNRPSEADKKLTKQIVEAGKILNICVLDHIILTEDSYYSFADDLMI